MTGTIALLNGPNLNLLGVRKPEVYGRATLADVEQLCRDEAARHGLGIEAVQSNHEGALIDAVHELRATAVGFVVNAGAFTHTSVALRDALETIEGPLIEVHISNVHAREAFRHHSYLSPIASGIIVGCGIQGYAFAVARIAELTGA
ncbi:3-dehydroquinate dehydratase-2 [Kineosphaera limosa]|uniref:3-dehydroquinate dehydratase n=1 Tax=Kineosphaera limosa NBRC 100340 TaxID=1184609 RepID=K6VGL1_9MICO|nr:type II 3-dehydroquinate dehydratase [Kineosphaera limosa]NYE02100.1 3-dehydroquinate dehydratase-2 [Kineosphaera limosa]GAB95298.1 3-dehydroquinate dehydratase [Kineosphaera limosa NBRC 100340]